MPIQIVINGAELFSKKVKDFKLTEKNSDITIDREL